MWLATPKAHAIEFLRIVGWDEFKQMMEEAKKSRDGEGEKDEESGA